MQYSVKHNYDFWLPVLEQGPIRNKSLQKDNKVNLFYKGEKIVYETNNEKKEGKNEINLGKRDKTKEWPRQRKRIMEKKAEKNSNTWQKVEYWDRKKETNIKRKAKSMREKISIYNCHICGSGHTSKRSNEMVILLFKVAATSLKLEERLHPHQVGMNTQSRSEVIFTFFWLAYAFGTRLLCT